MEWNSLCSIVRFCPMEQVFNEWKAPELKIKDRPLYYMGEGIFIGFTERQFNIENLDRIEYGEIGEYALNVYVYRSMLEITTSLNLQGMDFRFGTSPIIFPIGNGITFGISHTETIKILKYNKFSFDRSEIRSFDKVSNTFNFKSNVIHCNQHTLEYFGEEKKSTFLGGVQYNLQ